jgi:drug/metabolite transporter (DMT)-like permease
LQGVLFALITVIIWSGNYVVARDIITAVPPIAVAFFRWFTATVLIFILFGKRVFAEKKLLWQHKWHIFFSALTGVAIFNTFIYLAGHYTQAINLALIGTTVAPLIAVFLSAVVFKEKVKLIKKLGIIISLVGILLLLSKGNFYNLINFHFSKGDILMLISATAFAIYNLLVKTKPTSVNPFAYLATTFLVGTIMILPFYVAELMMSNIKVHVNIKNISTFLYLGAGNSVIGFLLWNKSIKLLGASTTVLFTNLIPLFSAMEAIVFLQEPFYWFHIVSGIIIISGVVMATLTSTKK